MARAISPRVVPLRREAGAPGNNVPSPLSSLIGRERDLVEVAATLSSARLVTLTGTGGVGKTRLALEAAARSVGDFPGGVWWIELASLCESDPVESPLIRALGVRPLPGLSELDAAIGFLSGRHALLVFDNCEQVIEKVAGVAQAVLSACPSASILATSRVPLAIRGETRWAVPPLSVPADHDRGGLSESDAVQLFVDRARRVDRSLDFDAANAQAIGEICRRLEGIPLALELAASRVAVLPPAAIASGLEGSLGLLSARSRDGDRRHETLRASLDWSYGLLPDAERRLFRRLGVFSGGTTLELAREVCADADLADERILEVLEVLVEHSLLSVDARPAGVRYRLLETVRQYALERLDEAGEQDLMRDRHRDALLAVAERQRRDALTPRQPEVFAALDPEAANLAAALDRALDTDADKALRLCLALDFWYRARARFREADSAYARAIAASHPSPVLQARALAAWAWIVGSWGDFGRANELAAAAAAQAKTTGDAGAIANTRLVLANHRFFTDPLGALEELHRCRDYASEAGDEYILTRAEALVRGVAWFQQDEAACAAGFDDLRPRLERLGDRETLAWFWFEQGAVRYPLGDHEAAGRLLGKAIAAAAEIGEPTADRAARAHLALIDVAAGRAATALAEMYAIHEQTLRHGGSFALPWIEVVLAQAEAGAGALDEARARLAILADIDAWGAAHALAWAGAELAEVLRLLGDGGEATRHARRALEHAHRLGNTWLGAKAGLTLGRLAAAKGDWAEAEALHHDALAIIWQRRYRLELPAALEALADVAAGRERHADAARTLAVAERARRELGFVAWPAQRAESAAVRARVEDVLGPAAFERASSEGAALSRDDAVAWLRRARGTRNRPGHGWESLTPTEVEVVRHAAAGLTNPQIAEQLFIARATVKVHLSHVYAKLGVRNRSQLAGTAAGRFPPIPD